jgi:hypothetical protein
MRYLSEGPMGRKQVLLLEGAVLATAGSALPAGAVTHAFHDEFSGTSLNKAVWTAQTASFGGVCASAGNVHVSGGYLRMTARQGSTAGCPWVGSRVISQGKQYLGYGLAQARVRWNAAQGFWGGFGVNRQATEFYLDESGMRRSRRRSWSPRAAPGPSSVSSRWCCPPGQATGAARRIRRGTR